MSDHDADIDIEGASGVTTSITSTPPGDVTVYVGDTEVVEIITEGPQGIPGAGVILLEVGETEPPLGTPAGSIIFRKLS